MLHYFNFTALNQSIMKTKFLLLFLVLNIFQTIELTAQFGGGAGTEASPYIVANEIHLNNVRDYLSSHFVQTNDIDLTNYQASQGWLPIGTKVSPFRGVFNGKGFRIRNLKINRPSSNDIGLFGVIKGVSTTNLSRIIDVHLEYVDVIGNENVGGLLGVIDNDHNTQILLCSVEGGSVSGKANVGGLIGAALGTKTGPATYSQTDIGSCFTNVNVRYNAIVNNLQNLGGVVGYVYRGQLNNCYSIGNVYAVHNVGPNVYTAELVGGLIGSINQGYVYNCFSAGAIFGVNNHIGGLIGAVTGSGIYGTDYYSYWDTQSSGQNSSGAGEGQTTSWFMDQSNFLGWDFSNFWGITPGINNGYPYLIHNMPMFFLPINLLKINAEEVDNFIKISWQTLSENNNEGFYVQKANELNDFQEIAFVKGSGSSNQIIDYVFYDFDTSFNGNDYLYYRLKQIDFDGQQTYYDIIAVKSQKIFNDFKIYPNPFVNELFIELMLDDEDVEVLLYDINGKAVVKQKINHNNSLNLKNLDSGIYFVKLISNGSVLQTQKIVKQ